MLLWFGGGRAHSGAPAVAVLHAGWRGLAEGVVDAGVRALGSGPTAAIVGPAVGPCCYEVGPDVSALFDADLTKDGILTIKVHTATNGKFQF